MARLAPFRASGVPTYQQVADALGGAAGATTMVAGPIKAQKSAIGTSTANGLTLENPTAATAIATVQQGPAGEVSGSAWVSGASQTMRTRWVLKPRTSGHVDYVLEYDRGSTEAPAADLRVLFTATIGTTTAATAPAVQAVGNAATAGTLGSAASSTVPSAFVTIQVAAALPETTAAAPAGFVTAVASVVGPTSIVGTPGAAVTLRVAAALPTVIATPLSAAVTVRVSGALPTLTITPAEAEAVTWPLITVVCDEDARPWQILDAAVLPWRVTTEGVALAEDAAVLAWTCTDGAVHTWTITDQQGEC